MQNTFSDRLISWYFQNGRSLPWRDSGNPYFIWISEIILQQTRVSQGLDYYRRFIERFPTLSELANAPEDEVLVQWQGLGYYSRARNLHAAAQHIQHHHGGIFPSEYAQIIRLKGIGEYTASAICAFAFHQPYLALDGNAYRVFSRYFAIDLPIDTLQGQRLIKARALEVFDTTQPQHFNQAIMDLGSGICTPKQTRCSECPLQSGCLAYSTHAVQSLPVKQGKTKQKNRYFTFFAHVSQGRTYLYKRSSGDIWHGLYAFPEVESEHQQAWMALYHRFIQDQAPQKTYTCRSSDPYLHLLSHQRLHVRFLIFTHSSEAQVAPELLPGPEGEWVGLDTWMSYPVSRLMDRFLRHEKFLSLLSDEFTR